MNHVRWILAFLMLSAGIAAAQVVSLPPLNQRVLGFADAHLGKPVGTGECWDLAAAALNEAGANWDGKYRFGREVDLKAERVLPGDIIQFEGIETLVRTATSESRERMGHHTAIVHATHGDGRYTLAHQNFGPSGRKVGLTEWDARTVIRGRYTIYRPVQ